ncbi:MAG: hypothetical protein ACFFC7_01335 [Candidatus Hermodarchaeota archaeon]
MSKRVCANCGKEKPVYRSKICEKKDHFICEACSRSRSTCPLCGYNIKLK